MLTDPPKILLALALGLLACAPRAAGPEPDSLVVVTIDTLRRDHLGCYGYFRDTSPAIDALAAESLVFDACRAPVSQTLPTHTSLFTGLYPYEHGIEANLNQTEGRYVPSAHVQPVASWLREHGYTTAAFVSAEPVKRGSGLAEGFAVWSQPERVSRRADETVDLALEWLRKRSRGPYHLWLHVFDAHLPYEPPAPFDTHFQPDPDQEAYMGERQFLETLKPSRWRTEEQATRLQHDLYDGEILFADTHIGRFLDGLRKDRAWERTVLVVTSDHGEGLGQHYLMGHEQLWSEQLDVPLLVRAPGLEPGRNGDPLTSRDVLPTVLPLVRGIDPGTFLARTTGSNLLDPGSGPGPTFAQSPGSHPKQVRSVTAGNWRLIVGMVQRDLLFDLAEDPHELRNRAKRHKDKVVELKALLDAALARQEGTRERLEAGRLEAVSADRIEGLKALGYAGEDH